MYYIIDNIFSDIADVVLVLNHFLIRTRSNCHVFWQLQTTTYYSNKRDQGLTYYSWTLNTGGLV